MGKMTPEPVSSDQVVVGVDALNIRSAPMGAIIGKTTRGKVWTVTGRVQGSDGGWWVQSGPTAHLAEWLTKPVYPPPPPPTPTGDYASPVGTESERASGVIWPGDWFDALLYLHLNGGSYHTGADLNLNKPEWNTDKDASVYAIGAGIVAFAGALPGTWGNVVVIWHGSLPDGMPMYSRYAHLATVNMVAGDQVDKYTVVGTIGTMPGKPGWEHLHFDISRTNVLGSNPGHWPGADREAVLANYVDPKLFLQANG